LVVVDWRFYRGFLRKCVFCGGVFVVSCGGMCGKGGEFADTFWPAKDGTVISTLFFSRLFQQVLNF
jgi:hypothetical protein